MSFPAILMVRHGLKKLKEKETMESHNHLHLEWTCYLERKKTKRDTSIIGIDFRERKQFTGN